MRLFFWMHPEWWALALSAAAWTSVLFGPALSQHSIHGAYLEAPATVPGIAVRWLGMVIAMMLPLIVPSIRAVAERSLWPRRHRAIVAFLAGYLVPWSALGTVVAVAIAFGIVHAGPWLGGSIVAAAAAWQLTPLKWRALHACHRKPTLSPHGWCADRDSVRFGYAIGVDCVTSCWLLMLACVLSGHSPPVMGLVTIVTISERIAFRPTPRRTSAALVSAAIFFAASS